MKLLCDQMLGSLARWLRFMGYDTAYPEPGPDRTLIERARAIPMPQPERAEIREPVTYPGGAGNVSRGESLKRGVGFAVGYKNVAYSEGFDDFHEARVTLSRGPDGPMAEVHSAGVECGQGLSTVMVQSG